MKITIEGEINLDQLAGILAVINTVTGPGISKAESPLLGTIKGNFVGPTMAEVLGGTSNYTGPGPDEPGHTGTSGEQGIEKAPRTRRTKEQIAADNAKQPAQGLPAPAVNGSGKDVINFEELKLFAQEKAQDEANVPKIKAKLKEFGVTKTKELEARPETHNAYWIFLQAL